jgi:hypothetical protein
MPRAGAKSTWRLSAAAAFGASALAAASTASAQIIVNGGFEAPASAPPGAAPSGWSISPGAPIGIYTGNEYNLCCGTFGTPADMANQFVSFGPGNVANGGVLSQTTGALAAGNYVLTYEVGALGDGEQSLSATLSGAAAGFRDVTAPADNDMDTTFATYTLDFTTAGGPVTVGFSATSGGVGDDVDVILDNVSITSAAVTEPATWAMMLGGLGSLGLALRRRRAVLAPAKILR